MSSLIAAMLVLLLGAASLRRPKNLDPTAANQLLAAFALIASALKDPRR
jgi:hypothetical protein